MSERKTYDQYNKVIMIGTLTKDPELKELKNGSHVASFRVANNRYGDKTTFIGCDLFGNSRDDGKENRAQVASRVLKKGTKILLEGSLEMSQSEKDGQQRTFYNIKVSGWEFAGAKPQGDSDDGAEDDGDIDFP
jgi:single-strand DNA-binding protein